MHRTFVCVRNAIPGPSVRCGVSACVLLAIASAGGCASPYANGEPTGPRAAWVQRSTPISPAPVEYERREIAAPPILALQSMPVIDFSSERGAGPAMPNPLMTPPNLLAPPEPQAGAFPPLAPAAETPALPMPETPAPHHLQAKIDELSAHVAKLDQRLHDQARALEAAQRDAAVAQQMTQQLLAEFVAWRVDLDLVREAIRAQGAADLQALDELNSTLEQVLTPTDTPAGGPATAHDPQMATQRRSGVSK